MLAGHAAWFGAGDVGQSVRSLYVAHERDKGAVDRVQQLHTRGTSATVGTVAGQVGWRLS